MKMQWIMKFLFGHYKPMGAKYNWQISLCIHISEGGDGQDMGEAKEGSNSAILRMHAQISKYTHTHTHTYIDEDLVVDADIGMQYISNQKYLR